MNNVKKCFFFIIILAFSFLPLELYADAYESLLPLLIDLSGWDGEAPDGGDMSYTGMSVITATREYRNGDKKIEVAILIGMLTMGGWNPGYQEGFKMETMDTLMEVKKINGFTVLYTYEKDEHSGMVMVLIQEALNKPDSGAVFVFNFEGLKIEEAHTLAQEFNWKKIKEKIGKLE